MALSRQPLAGSHLSKSFKRHFSQQIHQENLKQEQSVVPTHASDVSVYELAESSTGKEDSEIDAESLSELSLKYSGRENLSSFKFSFPETPVKCDDSVNDEMANVLKTPVQMASTPAKLTSATPMIQPPKRCYMSPDDNNSSPSASKLVRRPPANRPLKFDTPVKKSVKVDDEYRPSAGDDILDILPQSLVQSVIF